MLNYRLYPLDLVDEDELERLYFEHRNAMYTVAHSILMDQRAAENALSLAFSVCRKNFYTIKKLTPPEQHHYLCRVAKDCAYRSLHTTDGKRTDVPLSAPISTISTVSTALDDDTLDALCQAKGVQTVKACILTLDGHCREVLYLHYVADLSPRKIAKRLGTDVKTVRCLLTTGKKQLIERLEQADSDGSSRSTDECF